MVVVDAVGERVQERRRRGLGLFDVQQRLIDAKDEGEVGGATFAVMLSDEADHVREGHGSAHEC